MNAFSFLWMKKRDKSNKNNLVSIKRIVFFILILFASLAQAQQNSVGIPYFENIPFSKIGYSGRLGNLVQNDEGVIFVENEHGILYFNGATWKLLPFYGLPTLHTNRQGDVIVNTPNFIGKISRDNQNQLKVFSVLPDTIKLDGKVTSVVPLKDNIYYVVNENLYELNNGKVTLLEHIPGISGVYADRERLIVATKSCVYYYKGKTLYESNDLTIISTQRTDSYLYLLTNKGIVRCSSNDSEYFKTDIDSIQSDFSSFSSTNSNTLCIGTKNHGAFCLNEKGAVQAFFSESVGLIDNRILGMLADKSNNIWVSTRNGVSRIETNSAISYYNKYNGLRGNVLSMVKYAEDKLIVGTDCGVFKIDNTGCKKVCSSQCNAVSKTKKGEIVAATNQGLQLLTPSQNGIEQTLSVGDYRNVYVIDNSIISVKGDLLSIWKESLTSYPKYVPKYQLSIPDIEFTSIIKGVGDCFAFCGTKHNGLWMLKWQNSADSASGLELVPCDWQGLPKRSGTICVYETSSGRVFSTRDGLFCCDTINKFFYRDSRILLPESEGTIVAPIVEDGDHNLWMAFQKSGTYETPIAVAWNTNNRERYTLITAPFAKLRGVHIDHILTDKNSIFWLGGKDGLVRMDFNRMVVRKVLGNVQLSRVCINKDSLLAQNVDHTVLSYKTSSILFDFVSIEYENHDDILYSCFLEGYDQDWSQPTNLSEKEYRDLPSGKYVFHVVAKRANGASSKETTFSFEIKQHPLLSIWAMAFYVILLIAVVLWFLKIRSKGIAREKKVVTKIVENKTRDLQKEKDKSDTLLTNILPDETAKELKETGRVRSMNFEMATVLFSDFKGFTKIANRLSADTLIQELDKYFSEFDKIVDKYNVEKIKTIGDAYMCAGGIPKKNTTNPIEVVAVALEMQYRLSEMQKELPDKSELWGVRIGIHTGPVIAGVLGSKKFSYDIWGDSVNVANRMESSGEVGRVNVSESTYLLIRDIFDCEYRGKVPVKGMDEKMDMYFVNGFKAIYAENPLKSLPNREFTHKLALFRFDGLQDQIYSMLEQNLPSIYFYHNLKHTIDVVAQVEVIGQAEQVNDEDMYILKTAALFHDAGFMRSYKNHEHASIEIAKEILPNEGYTSEQIARICRLIECTIISEEPRNLLEQIIRDADLDYLGRSDYECVSRELYNEFLEMKIVKKNEYEWLQGQIKFLQEHTYYTNYSRSNRNPEKVRHIQKIQEQITKFNIIV